MSEDDIYHLALRAYEAENQKPPGDPFRNALTEAVERKSQELSELNLINMLLPVGADLVTACEWVLYHHDDAWLDDPIAAKRVGAALKLKEGIEEVLGTRVPKRGKRPTRVNDSDEVLMRAVIGNGPYEPWMLHVAARIVLDVKRPNREHTPDELYQERERIRESCQRRGLVLREPKRSATKGRSSN